MKNMKQEFKIDFKNQFNSLKKYFFILLSMICGLIIFGCFKQNFIVAFYTLFIFFTFFSLMVLPFHIQYLIKNWNTKLIIDFKLKTIKIIEKDVINEFNISEISTERIITNDYSSYKSPIENYGFIRIKTKEKGSFIITSLMANPLKFPLKIDNTIKTLPYIKKEYSKSEIEYLILQKNESEEHRINIFINSFKQLSNEELNSKILNKNTIVKEAVIAAERILKERI